MSAIKLAVQFSNNDFTQLHVVTENKEKMYVDVQDDKKLIVVYESLKQFNDAKQRWKKSDICMSYKELTSYFVDVSAIRQQFNKLGLTIKDGGKHACC
jgi:hypothetical protein